MTTIPDRLRIESVERNENGPYYRMGDGSWVKHYPETSPFGNHDLARGERHSTPGTCDRWITDHDEARVIWGQIKALDEESPTTPHDPAATLDAAESAPGAGGATGGDAPALVGFLPPFGYGGAVGDGATAPPEPFELFEWETTPVSTPEQDRRDEQDQQRKPY